MNVGLGISDVIKIQDMSEDMKNQVLEASRAAIEKYNSEKEIASYIKEEFIKKYPGTWHCVVGRNFGCSVTHESKHYIYFYIGQRGILLFKSG